jgi:hypothetical protein
MKCIACAFYESLGAPPAGADEAGMCYGSPPRLMLLPGQAATPGRVVKPNEPPQMQMQLMPMRPSVRAVDRACSLFQAALKH